MITGLGAVFLPLCLFYWRTPSRLLELVFIGAAFAAAAVLVFGGYGISPGLIPAALFAGCIILQSIFGTRHAGERMVLRVFAPFLLAVTGGLISSFLMPRLFAGAIMVWPEKMSGLGAITPLAPNAGNLTQDVYLLLNALLAITAAVYLTRAAAPLQRLLTAYFAAGLIVIAISLWQFAANETGLWFPTSFFLSNPGWALLSNETVGTLVRINGPFSEPAALASYLSGSVCAAAWVILNGSKSWVARLVLTGGATVIILSTSTTGYATLAITVAILIIYTVFNGSAALRRRVVTGFIGAAALVGVAIAVIPVVAPSVMQQVITVAEATATKQSSSSYNDRVTADHDSLHEMAESYGLGVGWGSNRSSSLIPGLCAALGVWGMLLLLWFTVEIVVHVRIALRLATSAAQKTVMQGCCGALIGSLAASIISAPGITSPDFFLLLALLVGTAARARFEARAPRPSPRPAAFFAGSAPADFPPRGS